MKNEYLNTKDITSILPLVFTNDASALGLALEDCIKTEVTTEVLTILRIAALQPSRSTMWYQKLLNLWVNLGRPPLKPNWVSKKLVLLSNHTIENFIPFITITCAALGINIDIQVQDYDSVELDALNPESTLYAEKADYIAIVFSEHWLFRFVGQGGLVCLEGLDRAIEMIEKINESILRYSGSIVLISNFTQITSAQPGSVLVTDSSLGWTAAVSMLNAKLYQMQGNRLVVFDLADAVYSAGGRSCLSTENYFRAKMPYNAHGTISIARELALAISALSGKSHRALISDFDNTLWGGEVGEIGFNDILCSQNDPVGLGFYFIQEYIKSLKSVGILLAAASKNSPHVLDVFKDNPNLPLDHTDFATVYVNWNPKSNSVSNIAADLGFGPEYMVFIDDSIFQLAEVLQQHPHIDVILASRNPAETLSSLSKSRFFNHVQLSAEDVSRNEWMLSQKKNRDFQMEFTDYDDYLKTIKMQIEASPLIDKNRRRIVHLLQKTNQFNLTTRRHNESDLDELLSKGAIISAFSYEDIFGPQGVISVVILIPENASMRIENWVMSCRVLNRTVENAIWSWMIEQVCAKPLLGEYIPTEKNSVVSTLYKRMKCKLKSRNKKTGCELWEYSQKRSEEIPKHFIKIKNYM